VTFVKWGASKFYDNNKTTFLFKTFGLFGAAEKVDIKMKQTKPTLPPFVGIQSNGLAKLT
jgi:hypothetical protein